MSSKLEHVNVNGNIEYINPSYVASLSKLVNRNQSKQTQIKKIDVLSDIKIGQKSNSFYIGDYGEPKPSTSKF